MILYIIKRTLFGLIAMLVGMMLIFWILSLSNVDPARAIYGEKADEKVLQKFRETQHLDHSVAVQMLYYLNDLSPLHFVDEKENINQYRWTLFRMGTIKLVLHKPDFGVSYSYSEPVISMVGNAFLATLVLALCAMFFGVVVGVLLGIVSSRYYGLWQDQLIQSVCTFFISLPSFITAIILSFILAFSLGAWTGLEIQGGLFEIDDWGNEVVRLRNLILPALALGSRPIAVICQMTRSAFVEVAHQDYMRTAKSKGLSEYYISWIHQMRNTLNPILTTVSGWFASVLTGAVFVESVFNYKGLGDLCVSALNHYDRPLILACSFLFVLVFVTINLLADLVNAWNDPRIQIQ
ncbi:MAG TPA: ABC transporter permease [Saprospiraceae bacterium]|nr:ABC transporter permease [Saprospiraceae bacterium]